LNTEANSIEERNVPHAPVGRIARPPSSRTSPRTPDPSTRTVASTRSAKQRSSTDLADQAVLRQATSTSTISSPSTTPAQTRGSPMSNDSSGRSTRSTEASRLSRDQIRPSGSARTATRCGARTCT
jgi:hypothetical protein